jgi:hypothetical protein
MTATAHSNQNTPAIRLEPGVYRVTVEVPNLGGQAVAVGFFAPLSLNPAAVARLPHNTVGVHTPGRDSFIFEATPGEYSIGIIATGWAANIGLQGTICVERLAGPQLGGPAAGGPAGGDPGLLLSETPAPFDQPEFLE